MLPYLENHVFLKTVEKLTKYVDMKIEVSRLWKSKKVFVVPIIIGALGSVSIDLPFLPIYQEISKSGP